MNSSLARLFCVTLLLTTATPAYAVEDKPTHQAPQARELSLTELKVTKAGDLEKSCGPLSAEAANMRDIIYVTQDIKNKSNMQSHGVTAAGTIGSFLIGSVTGGIGLAVGGMLIDYSIDGNADDAEKIQDIAQQRRTLMMGIYNAKNCQGPLEHAMQNPEEFDPLGQLASTDGTVYHGELRRRYNN